MYQDMRYQHRTHSHPRDRAAPLPDPEFQPEYYDGVTMKRALAWVMDVVLLSLLTFAIGVATLGIGLFFAGFIYLVVSFFYRVSTLMGGGTWGMRFFGIEIRNRAGTHLSGGEAVLHVIGYLVSIATFFLMIVGWALMLFSPRGQGLNDLLVGAVALNRAV